MQFSPKSEEEIQQSQLLSPGVYDFEVFDANDEVSQRSGNEMIHLKLKVYGDDGNTALVHDYLLEKMEHKLRHFCASADILDLYENGVLSAQDCRGRAGKVKLKIESDKSGQYSDKNSVVDYIVDDSTAKAQPSRQRQAAPATAGGPQPVNEEDIPF